MNITLCAVYQKMGFLPLSDVLSVLLLMFTSLKGRKQPVLSKTHFKTAFLLFGGDWRYFAFLSSENRCTFVP